MIVLMLVFVGKHLATKPTMETILNTHPIITPARFEISWKKPLHLKFV